jgi:DNA-binding MarR family transcriptional regulator
MYRLALTTYRTGLLQSKAHRALSAFMTGALSKSGLSAPQWALLGVLTDKRQLRPSQISAELGVKPPVTTALLNELVAKKLIVRVAHGSDNRAALVGITDAGAQLVATVEHDLRKEMKEFLKDVKIPELIVYMRVLNKIASKV